MDEAEAPKRRGRPPKAPKDRKAGNLTIRTYGDLRQKLEAAARRSGRSVSGEVEFMLERAFAEADIIAAVRAEIREVRLVEASRHLSERPEPYINQSAPPH